MSCIRVSLILLISAICFWGCKEDIPSDDNPNDPFADNKRPLGTSAEELLTDTDYNTLLIEFVYAAGFRPREATITALRTFLNTHLNKPGGILIQETVIDAPEGAPYNSQEIRDIEDNNRTAYNEGNTIAVYVFFSNGSAFGDSQNTVTLGSAYRNTSIVIYEKTLRDIAVANPTFGLTNLETTTLQHEFGHLLGLTNILDDDIHNMHEDPNRNKHCVVEECLMYFEASFSNRSDLMRVFGKGNTPKLDPLCIEDLQAKGGK